PSFTLTAPPPPLLPLCGRRLPLPADKHSTKGRTPLRPTPPRALPLLAAALAGGASAHRLPSCERRTRSRPPLTGWLRATVCRPLAAATAAWPRAATAPCRRGTTADHPRATATKVWPRAGAAPLRAGPGDSRPPLCRAFPLFAPLCVAAPAQVAGLAAGGPLAVAPFEHAAGSRPLRARRGQQPLASWLRAAAAPMGGRPM
ncbi:hypothetical protein BHM03_00060797, partial [Ensete ventricosum]